jgi:type II secretory pathway pseudopilin PulG
MSHRSRARGDAAAARRDVEQGETLIELLVTIVVLSIAGVALVSMMTSSVLAADAHRSLAHGEAVLREYAESYKSAAAGLDPWEPCPRVDELENDYTPPDGWTASVTSAQWWVPNAASGSFGSRSACDARVDDLCPSDEEPFCDPGLIRLTLQVEGPGEHSAPLETTVVVRRNDAVAGSGGGGSGGDDDDEDDD